MNEKVVGKSRTPKRSAVREPRKKPVDQPLEIYVGWQQDGGVYGLEPLSKRAIQEAFPQAVIHPLIMIGHDRSADIDRFHRPHWEQMAQMLTGLTAEQIARLGGVRIYDPEAEKVIWEWRPPSATHQ
jgi:hypothetical protein